MPFLFIIPSPLFQDPGHDPTKFHWIHISSVFLWKILEIYCLPTCTHIDCNSKKCDCLNEIDFYKLICLNIWPLIVVTIQDELGGVALLEELCFLMGACFEVTKDKGHFLYLSALCLWIQMWTLSSMYSIAMSAFCHASCHDGSEL